MRPIPFCLFALLLSLGQPVFAGEEPDGEGSRYTVIINHEEQYSIWPAERELPRGWKSTGFAGSREASLRYIEEVWTDMRPLSMRREAALEIYRDLQRER